MLSRMWSYVTPEEFQGRRIISFTDTGVGFRCYLGSSYTRWALSSPSYLIGHDDSARSIHTASRALAPTRCLPNLPPSNTRGTEHPASTALFTRQEIRLPVRSISLGSLILARNRAPHLATMLTLVRIAPGLAKQVFKQPPTGGPYFYQRGVILRRSMYHQIYIDERNVAGGGSRGDNLAQGWAEVL